MKKTYFAPKAIVVKIATVGMLALSMNKYETTGTLGNPENSLGRESSFEDEE
jgi:hypothetical protein